MPVVTNQPAHGARTLWRAALLACGAVVLAAALAPWIFRLTQQMPLMAQYPFRRVFDRVAAVCLIVVFAAGWRWLHVRITFLPLFKRRRAVSRGATWLVIGVVCITVLVLAQVWSELRVYRRPLPSAVLLAVVQGFFSAACVSLLEESIFRGYMLQALLATFERYRAILLTSAIFAVLHLFTLDHFLKPIREVQLDGMQWQAGFQLLALFFVPLRQPLAVLPGLLGLFLAGWLLAELTVRTKSLWPAIGLHAGWVWAIKVTGRIWKYIEPPRPDTGPVWLFGEKYAATGVLGWLVVGALILLVNGLAAYAFYRVAVLVMNMLTQQQALRLGRACGRLAFRLDFKHRRVALENLRHAFPDKSEDERRVIARGSFETLGVVGAEMLRFRRMVRQFNALVDVQGLEHVAAVRARGHGVVFFTGHFGNWEVFPLACGVQKYPFAGVARPHANEWIYRDIVRTRTATGVEILDKKNILRELVARLRNGRMVGFVGDQYAGADGLFVEFFGRPASTIGAMAVLARKTGAALIPAFDHILPDGTHRPVVHSPLYVAQSDDADKDVFAATQALMTLLEEQIRKEPQRYVWAHRKWRARR
jgi:KDO2-lipid IV(A) lauroyltransferase